jgi:hypothetical protein
MTKSYLFVPVIDIMMNCITPQKATFIKIETMISRRKCGREVNFLTFSQTVPSLFNLRMIISDFKTFTSKKTKGSVY